MTTEIPRTQARLVRRSEATTLPRVGAKRPTKEQAA